MIHISINLKKKNVIIQRDDENPLEIPVKVFLKTADIILQNIQEKK